MATLQLTTPSRSILSAMSRWSAIRPRWSLPCIPSSSSAGSLSVSGSTATPPAEATAPLTFERPDATWKLALIPLLDSIAEMFPPILLAVPKHKVTHSRKSMRSANKGLKNKTNFSHCEACGMIKLAHNVCPSCYSQISRRWKREARGDGPASTSGTSSQSVEA